jgi:uncharacterized protein YjbJ (UPF0337 family)
MGAKIDKLKGKAKKLQGAITGSRSKKVEGAVEEMKGKVKERMQNLQREVTKRNKPEY